MSAQKCLNIRKDHVNKCNTHFLIIDLIKSFYTVFKTLQKEALIHTHYGNRYYRN